MSVVDEWGTDGMQGAFKRPKGRYSVIPAPKRAEVVRRLRAGESRDSVSAATGVSRSSVALIAQKHGIGTRKPAGGTP